MQRLLRTSCFVSTVSFTTFYTSNNTFSSPQNPSLKQSFIGLYEDKVRNFSNPEKVFELFASVTTQNGTFMTANDFARVITPYECRADAEVGSPNFKYNYRVKNNFPSEQQRQEYELLVQKVINNEKISPEELKKIVNSKDVLSISTQVHLETLIKFGTTIGQFEEKLAQIGGPQKSEFMSLVDIDGDGLISFVEFMLFVLFMEIPEERFLVIFQMFDEDESGLIDKIEFDRFIQLLKSQTTIGKHEVTHNISGERRNNYNDSIVYRKFFGNDGSKKMNFQIFCNFIKDLRREAIKLQFSRHDIDQKGYLTATEFARCVVSFMDWKSRGPYLNRIGSNELQEINQVHVSVDDFVLTKRFLRHADKMKIAISMTQMENGLTKETFLRAIDAVCSDDMNYYVIPPHVVDILFVLFDLNGDKRLDMNELFEGLNRFAGVSTKRRDLGIMENLSRIVKCLQV